MIFNINTLFDGAICNNNREYFNELIHKLIGMLYPKKDV